VNNDEEIIMGNDEWKIDVSSEMENGMTINEVYGKKSDEHEKKSENEETENEELLQDLEDDDDENLEEGRKMILDYLRYMIEKMKI
jgi:hypothetical protein